MDLSSGLLHLNCLEIFMHPARFLERCEPAFVPTNLHPCRQLGTALDVVDDLGCVLVFLAQGTILCVMYLATPGSVTAFSRWLATSGDFVFHEGETLQSGGGLSVVLLIWVSSNFRICGRFAFALLFLVL